MVETQTTQQTNANLRYYGGKRIDGSLTVKEAIQAGGLDWDVALEQAGHDDEAVPGYFWNVRQDNREPLGIVKSKYRPIQNADAFTFVDEIIAKTGARIESVGELLGGRKTFISLNMGEFNVGTDDVIAKHLLIFNTHDSSGNLIIAPMPFRFGCMNMLNYLLGQRSGAVKIRHTASAKMKLVAAEKAITRSAQDFTNLEFLFNTMRTINIDSIKQDALIFKALKADQDEVMKWEAKELDRKPQWVEQADAIRRIAESGPGSELAGKGTLWNTFNAINGYFDHHRTVRNAGGKTDKIIDNKLFGTSAKGKENAFQTVVNYMKELQAA